MLSIARVALVTTEVGSLEPGKLFVYRERGHQRLAIALSKQGGNRAVWMNLTGKKAFQLEQQEIGAPSSALALPYPPDSLRLRIDVTSEGAIDDSVAGALVAGDSHPLAITAQWIGEDRENLVLVEPSEWELSGWNTPRFGFGRWALSVVDHSGEWVDFVVRAPSK